MSGSKHFTLGILEEEGGNLKKAFSPIEL